MQRDVGAAQRTLERLSALATSMLELSRIDAQAASGSATLTQLSEELADAADRGRTRVGSRDIRIDYNSGDPSETAIAVSVADFGRVCDNLLSNALAVMPHTGAIEITLEAVAGGARLVVADDAGGMVPEFVPVAFDRFSRADQARTGGGAGLGLPIVAGIATLAGGAVELQNRPGSGLSVIVTFAATARH